MNASKWCKTALVSCLAAAAGFPQAQIPSNYPSKLIRVIVPWGPGGMTDTFERIFANEMNKDNLTDLLYQGHCYFTAPSAVARA